MALITDRFSNGESQDDKAPPRILHTPTADRRRIPNTSGLIPKNGSPRQRPLPVILLAGLITLPLLHACNSAPTGSSSSSGPVSIRWAIDQRGGRNLRVEVHGIDRAALDRLRESSRTSDEWQLFLSVYAGRPGSTSEPSLPPMLGTYRVESDVLLFESQFAVEPEAEYRAVFYPAVLAGAAGEPITSVYQPPARDSSPATIVSRIYPSTDEVPENLLKFYVHFSAPMSRGRIYDHIHLRDSTGKDVELPFLEIDEELWDPAMTRLTLIIDPGRIKRGVRPLEELGPVLEAGKSYTLAIDSAWKDGAGVPLKQAFEKRFKVGSSDRKPVDQRLWQIQPPRPGTLEPLSVIFPEPMDSAVTPRSIGVTSDTGVAIAGQPRMEDEERRWTLVPDAAWRPGTYKLLIRTTIEDLAGNNIGKAFDVDKLEVIRKQPGSSTVTLAFEVR